MDNILKGKQNLFRYDEDLSNYATKSSDSIRVVSEEGDFRPAFYRDTDRIIHSLSFTRYINKTQVFSRSTNDHITRRITHVILVSKIARTIGRALRLNEDLIEAIALGHDIGHTPLGHEGEALLNEISLRELNEVFSHNIQSVRHLMYVENDGAGLNLSIQVLDGVMCHNGEMLSSRYTPQDKSVSEFLKQYNDSYHDIESSKKNRPMTLEGCVVRISDIIGYIGRDIEDAIRLDGIKREDVPESITSVLGSTNREIINKITRDIIEHSLDKPYIEMSESVFKALFQLKKFNYEHIYKYSFNEEEKEYYRAGMNKIFERYLKDIRENNHDSIIFKIFLDSQTLEYNQNTNDIRKVLDFIAGMTDELFFREIEFDNA